MDCRQLGSSVHGILQARILEWVAILSSRWSSWPRDWNCIFDVSCIGRCSLPLAPPEKPQILICWARRVCFELWWRRWSNRTPRKCLILGSYGFQKIESFDYFKRFPTKKNKLKKKNRTYCYRQFGLTFQLLRLTFLIQTKQQNDHLSLGIKDGGHDDTKIAALMQLWSSSTPLVHPFSASEM